MKSLTAFGLFAVTAIIAAVLALAVKLLLPVHWK